MSTKVDISKIPGLQSYLTQPQALNVAKGLKLPVLLNVYPDELETILSVMFGALIGLVSSLALPESLRSFSEFTILSEDKKLEKYLQIRYTAERIINVGQSYSQKTVGGRQQSIIKHFKNLGAFFTKIELANNFQWWVARLEPENKNHLLHEFYKSFNRDGLKLTKGEVHDLIGCLKFAKHPEILLQSGHYKNVIQSIRVFGSNATSQLIFKLDESAFDLVNYDQVEKNMLRVLKEKGTNMKAVEHVKLAIGETSLFYRINPEQMEPLVQLKTPHSSVKFYKGMRAVGCIAIGLAVAGIIYYGFYKEENDHTSINEKLNLTDDEILAQADSDPEFLSTLLNADKMLAAILAWMYDQVVQANRELKLLDQAAAE